MKHKLGTEEWFGWNYRFGDDYKIDEINDWLFFQVHNSINGTSPQVKLYVAHGHSKNSDHAGEIVITNNGNYPDYNKTGIVPVAGDSFDIVIHVIWGDDSNGLLQVWINGEKLYDKHVSTVYPEYPWGGNAKWLVGGYDYRSIEWKVQIVFS